MAEKGVPFLIVKTGKVYHFLTRVPQKVFYSTKSKIVSSLFLTKSGCLAALRYTQLPVSLGSYTIVLVDHLKYFKEVS